MIDWPKVNPLVGIKTNEEQRKVTLGHVCYPIEEWTLPYEVSSWPKLLRVTSYVRRFIFNCRNPRDKVLEPFLSANEETQAKLVWIKLVQQLHFNNEIQDLRREKTLRASSSIISLTPFIDDIGVLRVGGRLRRADLDEAVKFPMVLSKGRVSEMIIKHILLRYTAGYNRR